MDIVHRSKLAKRLYPSLSTLEITIWTVIWLFGAGYSIYHIYIASERRYLTTHDFEPGWGYLEAKDVSDKAWIILSQNLKQSVPWMLLNVIGTQYFQRQHQNLLPWFHLILPVLYLDLILMSDPILFAKHLTQIRGPRDNTTADLQGVLETSGIFAYLVITNIKSCI